MHSARIRFRWRRVPRRWGASTSPLVWQRFCFRSSERHGRETRGESRLNRTYFCLSDNFANRLPLHPKISREWSMSPICNRHNLSGSYVYTHEEVRTYGEMRVDIGIRRPLRFEHR